MKSIYYTRIKKKIYIYKYVMDGFMYDGMIVEIVLIDFYS